MFNSSPALEKLQSRIKQISAIGSGESALSLFNTTDLGPAGSRIAIGEVTGVLSGMQHEMLISGEIYDFVCELSERDLGEDWSRIIRALKRDIELKKSVPSQLVERIAVHSARANQSWMKAREMAKFEVFAPDLGTMIELQREEAACYGNRFPTPYDALIARFDSCLSVKLLDPLFEEAGEFLVEIMERVKEAEQPETGFLRGKFNHGEQLEISKILLEAMGMSLPNTVFATAVHPLTSWLIVGKLVAVTTRTTDYIPDSTLAVIHEGGHGLMAMNAKDPYAQVGNVISPSLSVHESSSRFWENHIGRSDYFVSYLLTLLKSRFPLQFADVDSNMLFKALNIVRPGFIRVAADQITYLAHILLRYEIEREIINGEIRVDEIPNVWNELMEKFLGIVPENPADGCLQDVHWGFGYFGYFPTYQVGNWLAATMEEWVKDECRHSMTGHLLDDLEIILEFLATEYYYDSPVLTTEEAVKRISGGTIAAIDLGPWKRHQLSIVDAVYG